ncbi:NUDIX domain-containing protein [Candidatus Saccharibacteria bacterium]|nr:NUDIX domain-containing protein [Candidatus Saccharibacteria bacterium]
MARHLTLMILKRGNKTCLGVKKRGFGAGKLIEAGGKVEPGETPMAAAIREAEEELDIKIRSAHKVGQLVFRNLYYKGEPETAITHVYMSEDFEGEPTETDELTPDWYDINSLPYNKMWGDDEHWMPEVFRGKVVDAYFDYNENDTFTDYRVDIVPDECIAHFRDKDFGFPEDRDESTFVTRTAARAVLIDKDNRVALVNATNRGYYKLPGGGIDEGELISEALHREVIEEAGYKIEVLCPLGFTHETRHKYEQFNISYAFLARATEFVGIKLEEDEAEDGFELQWFDNIDEAIKAVEKVDTENIVYQGKFFTARELAILREARKVLKERYGQ